MKVIFEPSNVHQGHYVIINGELSGIIVNMYAYQTINDYKIEIDEKIEKYILNNYATNRPTRMDL